MTFLNTDYWGFSYAMKAEILDSGQCWVVEPEFGCIWKNAWDFLGRGNLVQKVLE